MSSSGPRVEVVSTNQLFLIDQKKIELIANSSLKMLGLNQFSVNISFVSNRRIQGLNKTWLGKNLPTDVLSFPLIDWQRPVKISNRLRSKALGTDLESDLGDIVIAASIANRNAKTIGQKVDREVCFLIVHGLLHLCGHDHKRASDEKVMLVQQRQMIKALEARPKLWAGCVKKKKVVG